MDILEVIRKKVNLSEGTPVLERILVEIGIRGNTSTKQIARTVKLPLPLVAAVKNEFLKAGLLQRAAQFSLSPQGLEFLENELGYRGLDRELYCELLSGERELRSVLGDDYSRLEEWLANRPRADVTLDQSKGTAATALRRVLLALHYHMLIGKRVLCLGDDDLISTAAGLLLKRLFQEVPPGKEICVVDIDERFLDYIRELAGKNKLSIKCYHHDLRSPLPDFLQNCFHAVMTDPPYTHAGLSLFLSRAAEALAPQTEPAVFLSFAHKAPSFHLEMQRRILKMGFVPVEIIPEFNRYEGAEIIGNHSQMIVLKAVHCTPEIAGNYPGPLYTGEIIKTRRIYRCRQCQRRITVGREQEYPTIEELKTAGCPGCKAALFDLVIRTRSRPGKSS